jgi:RNA polymerase sigma factor (sigma-70 family)
MEAVTVEEEVEYSRLKGEIAAALAALPPRQRMVIVQRYYLGMNEKEMAETLSAPPGTIKWLLNAARQRLRTLLSAERNVE